MWRELGALQYCECVGDDLAVKGMMPFTRSVKLKPGETVVFAWITYRSKAQRDKVNAAVMKDPRMADMGAMADVFDYKRMLCGGFRTIVDV